ncbi:helix-turn-helix domain-containing protein [Amycolatopsis anabasis]|uniref:helix-turn-helix domain-containing protein n=1 Tax=Amycolatopsis anabasis TaxID=1840409 RepID=UPI00131B1E7E|nr:helix-turn-helix domain-containing protein [Amycolatopsis anabasis]
MTAPKQGRRTLTFPELFQLPATVDLTTAADAMGISANTAYKLIKREEFPCTVLRPGWHYRVPTMALMKALEVENLPIHLDDVDSGADFAARA